MFGIKIIVVAAAIVGSAMAQKPVAHPADGTSAGGFQPSTAKEAALGRYVAAMRLFCTTEPILTFISKFNNPRLMMPNRYPRRLDLHERFQEQALLCMAPDFGLALITGETNLELLAMTEFCLNSAADLSTEPASKKKTESSLAVMKRSPDVCYTAPAVTTTVTVTQCGHETTPAAPPSESNGHGPAPPPPAETTSWLPPVPAPASSSPAPSAPASGPPGPSDSASPASPASSGGSSGGSAGHGSPTSKPTRTATDIITPTSLEPGSFPTDQGEVQPPSNAASLQVASLGMGFIVVVGMGIHAAIAAFA